MSRTESCEARIGERLADTLADLQRVLRYDGWDYMDTAERVERCQECGDSPFAARHEHPPEDTPPFNEYGLSFDYVGSDTFEDQDEGYFRYQLSWGGPSDEFRFYVGYGERQPYRIEYWFLDWFDGASRTLYGEDRELLEEVWGWFEGCIDLDQMVAEAS